MTMIEHALQLTGWYGIISDLDSNPIYCSRDVSSCEVKSFLLELLRCTTIFVHDLLKNLSCEINQARTSDEKLGEAQCAMMILFRFTNNHKRMSRDHESFRHASPVIEAMVRRHHINRTDNV